MHRLQKQFLSGRRKGQAPMSDLHKNRSAGKGRSHAARPAAKAQQLPADPWVFKEVQPLWGFWALMVAGIMAWIGFVYYLLQAA
jgi:hypothetical protein